MHWCYVNDVKNTLTDNSEIIIFAPQATAVYLLVKI